MSIEAFEQYARECMRMAGETQDAPIRDTLRALARAWMDAALSEEAAGARAPPDPAQVARTR